MELISGKTIVRFKHHEHFRKALAVGGARRVDLLLSGRICKLSVTAEDGVFVMYFPNRRSLKHAVSNWQSLHGLELSVNERPCGVVHRYNPDLCRGG